MLGSGQLLLEGAWGLKTLTSQKVFSCLPPQKLFTAMSSRAPSWVLVEFELKVSVDKGCRSGSVLTSWHTSVSKLAVKSPISLCRRIGKLPVGQVKAWSIWCHIHNLRVFDSKASRTSGQSVADLGFRKGGSSVHVTDRIKRAKRALGGRDTCPHRKIFDFRLSEIAFGAVLG